MHIYGHFWRFVFDEVNSVQHGCCMAKRSLLEPGPRYGPPELEACRAIVAFHDQLEASPNPRHRPPDLDAFVRRLYIVQAVATLQALFPRRKLRDDIAKQVGNDFGVGQSWVFEARKQVDPDLRAAIETEAVERINYALRFAHPSCVRRWRLNWTR
jgi:hypothetical protein